MSIIKPPIKEIWADAGEKTEPSSGEISVGWPFTELPPSRQRFNWILNFLANGIRYFSRRGLVDYDSGETYLIGDRCIGDDGKTYVSIQNSNMGHLPSTSNTWWIRWGHTDEEIQGLIQIAPAITKGQRVFTASGSFTVPDNVTDLWVSGTAPGGGGGSGGGCGPDTSTGVDLGAGGSGGGAGQSIQKQKFIVTPGQIINIAIGAKGLGAAAAGLGLPGTSGTDGGNTVIGSLITLLGGGHGNGGGKITIDTQPLDIESKMWALEGPVGGAGYPAGDHGGDVIFNTPSGNGGNGANSPFGGGGRGGKANKGSNASYNGYPGDNGSGYGSGGGGGGGVNDYNDWGISDQSASGGAGGDGAPGWVAIEW